MYKFESRKDYIKALRSVIELLLLAALIVWILWMLMTTKTYQPYDPEDPSVVSGEDKGFLALSYFGVDRTGTDTLISTQRLEEHLKALSDHGYVTITQQDILDYYLLGKPLPDKAMFLMFEDGRRDTAIFSEKLLEKYNYLATTLTYAEKFETKDNKFLMPKDLKGLEKSTWWELGTNGYRLAYINAYDRYDRFLGELISREYIELTQFLGRDYNHYLMDYIRDEDRLPVESTKAMQERITHDYDLMEEIYTRELGALPKTYVLMHANTGMFGNVEAVSEMNRENMERLFAMNFNREGYSRNDRDCDLYDLTRMQPQAYWYVNHLLMRIWDDLPQGDKASIQFVTGDTQKAEDWQTESGAVEFKQEKIVVTSMPRGEGVTRLAESDSWGDVTVDVRLTGNKVGTQTVYLGADDTLSSYIAVTVQDDVLYIRQAGAGGEEDLFQLPLRELDDGPAISVEEDDKAALEAELGIRARYSSSAESHDAFLKAQQEAQQLTPRTVEDGAEEYIAELQILDLGDRLLHIDLRDGLLTVLVDGKTAAQTAVEETEGGGICLGAAWSGYGYSQRNLADEVYDGVFEQLQVLSPEGEVLYSNRLTDWEKTVKTAKEWGNAVINWFIETF